MNKKHISLLILLFSSIASFAQSITVGGDFDKFYPVTWTDPAWGYNEATVLKIGRSSVHENSTWRGSLIASLSYHTSAWGHGSHFIDASIRSSVASFIAGWRDASTGGSSGCIIVWLRGGNTTYYYQANYPITPVVYDGVLNALPFQEHNGPAHSYKTSIEPYVNSYGQSSSGSANFASTDNNYFAGNVGIGTKTPAAHLDISSNGAAIKLSSVSDPVHYALTITNNYDAANKFTINDGTQNVLGNKAVVGVLNNNAIPYMTGYYGLMFATGATAPSTVNDIKMVINPLGDVGIGTVTPKEKLSVNGKIRAHEIKVETTNWPDYVFESEHKLLSLSETEVFIKENKHLPEIPSATEVEKEGINLGEMNAKLLKKIEELTLYLIEQNKLLQSQTSTINIIKSDNEILKQRLDQLAKK